MNSCNWCQCNAIYRRIKKCSINFTRAGKLSILSLWRRFFYRSTSSLLLRPFVFRMAKASAKRVTGDVPQGTMGRVQTAAHFHQKRDVWVRGRFHVAKQSLVVLRFGKRKVILEKMKTFLIYIIFLLTMLGTSTASGNFSDDEGKTCVIFTSVLFALFSSMA